MKSEVNERRDTILKCPFSVAKCSGAKGIPVDGVDVGPFCDECLRDFFVADFGGHVEWSRLIVEGCIHIGFTIVQKKESYLFVSSVDGAH